MHDAQPKRFESPQELLAYRETHLGASRWVLIDQAAIDAFARATGDHQWIHVDSARAAAGPYGRTVAHGFLLLALLPQLSAELYEVGNTSMSLNYGLNRVRFTSVVPVDSRVRVNVTLLGAEEKESGIQINVRFTMEREGAEKPVMIAEHVRLLVPVARR